MDTHAVGKHGSSAFAGLMKGVAAILIFFVRLYQVTLGPVMGGHCRFHPTCSHYAIESLREHGAMRGTWLTIRRLLRCHPFGGFGFDPVPPRKTVRSKSVHTPVSHDS